MSFDLGTVIRRKCDDEYSLTKSFHLPKAMRKREYYVEMVLDWRRGYSIDDYYPKIWKSLNKGDR